MIRAFVAVLAVAFAASAIASTQYTAGSSCCGKKKDGETTNSVTMK